MSAFVLKREYALQLPNSYVEVDRDEMEYVDGGYRTSRTVYIPQRSFRMATDDYVSAHNAANTFIGLSISALSAACGIGLLGTTVGALFKGFVSMNGSTYSDATRLDKADSNGRIDGWLTVTVGGKWVTEFNPYPPHSYEGATF